MIKSGSPTIFFKAQPSKKETGQSNGGVNVSKLFASVADHISFSQVTLRFLNMGYRYFLSVSGCHLRTSCSNSNQFMISSGKCCSVDSIVEFDLSRKSR
ncbi:9414_t:CDS:2 [Entrophospora sp. SA101]|nr:9414_t:CDS:2 [Entrophospora sp. SA101]CAJ0898419.1 5078_t:CDS:2 [Entrophospora sp. SA101]